MQEVDPQTNERLVNLAAVGKALNDTYSENNLDVGTDFYMAFNCLNKFKEGIDELNLDGPTREGLDDLVTYLKKKITKRMGYNGSKM